MAARAVLAALERARGKHASRVRRASCSPSCGQCCSATPARVCLDPQAVCTLAYCSECEQVGAASRPSWWLLLLCQPRHGACLQRTPAQVHPSAERCEPHAVWPADSMQSPPSTARAVCGIALSSCYALARCGERDLVNAVSPSSRLSAYIAISSNNPGAARAPALAICRASQTAWWLGYAWCPARAKGSGLG